MDCSAVLMAPRGATGPVRGLVERLMANGVPITTVTDIDQLLALYNARPEQPPCVLTDLCDIDSGELDDWRQATDGIKRLTLTLPRAMPIAVTNGANTPLILACIRAGAADVIDLELEGTGTARAIIQRVWTRQVTRVVEAITSRSLRAMVDELVKDLVRTERRSIDLEERIERHHSSGEIVLPTDTRSPAILLIEHDRDVADELSDRLETAGIATYAYVSGEEALREARALSDSTGLDLALVAVQLPGIDGLETVRRLRDEVPGLAAFLVTSVGDADLAADAADLGVVGFVQKPLTGMAEVVQRLAQLAREALQRTREHLYLERIKQRHERVLARYRALPREA